MKLNYEISFKQKQEETIFKLRQTVEMPGGMKGNLQLCNGAFASIRVCLKPLTH